MHLAGLADATGPGGQPLPVRRRWPEHVLAGGSPLTSRTAGLVSATARWTLFARMSAPVRDEIFVPPPGRAAAPSGGFRIAAHWAFSGLHARARDRVARGEPAPDRAEPGPVSSRPPGRAVPSLPIRTPSHGCPSRTDARRLLGGESAVSAETDGRGSALPAHSRAGARVERGRFRLHRRIDRLPSGAVELIDYKTGRGGSPEAAGSSLHSPLCPSVQGRARLGRRGGLRWTLWKPAVRSSASPRKEELDSVRERLARGHRDQGQRLLPHSRRSRLWLWCDYRQCAWLRPGGHHMRVAQAWRSGSTAAAAAASVATIIPDSEFGEDSCIALNELHFFCI